MSREALIMIVLSLITASRPVPFSNASKAFARPSTLSMLFAFLARFISKNKPKIILTLHTTNHLTIKEKILSTPYIVIGYDIRTHSNMLFEALISGLNFSGCKILNIGLIATGVNYFASFQKFFIENKYIKPNASIMITGSHNAKKYNGFKITINNEPFFGDELLALYEKIYENQNIEIPLNLDFIEIDAKKLYVDFMVNQFSHLKDFKTPFIVDCGKK